MKLERRAIGRTTLEVTTLGFGAAPLAGLYAPLSDEAARATVLAALDQGLTYLDVAPFYGCGLAEHRLGRAIREAEDQGLVISTKVGRLLRATGRPSKSPSIHAETLPFEVEYDYSYDGVMRSLEDSYQRLGRARIDIAFLHDVNRRWHGDEVDRRFEEAMAGGYRALDELRRNGVVGAIGVGVNDPGILCRFARSGRFDCFMLAGRYTLIEQTPLDELFPLCDQQEISIVAAAPFNSGILATGSQAGAKYFYADAPPEIVAKVCAMELVCRRHDVPLPAAALQFPLAHPVVASVVAGFASPQQVRDNVAHMRHPIPAAFWEDLKGKGLLCETAPVPG